MKTIASIAAYSAGILLFAGSAIAAGENYHGAESQAAYEALSSSGKMVVKSMVSSGSLEKICETRDASPVKRVVTKLAKRKKIKKSKTRSATKEVAAYMRPYCKDLQIAAKGPSRKNFAGETYTENISGEKVFFKSFTPMNGRDLYAKRGDAADGVGYLEFPDGVSGKTPAVIIQHCGSGIKAHKEIAYAKKFREQGYATFIVDSFGLRSISDEGTNLKYVNIPMADAFAALDKLSNNSRIDKDRIAIVGWANAATGILSSQLSVLKEKLGKNDQKFAAAAAIQPKCGLSWTSSKIEGTPTLIQTGSKDSGFPSSACQEYAERLNSDGGNIQHIVYQGAGHNWQHPTSKPFVNTKRRKFEGCKMSFNEDTKKMELGNGQSVSLSDVDAMKRHINKCSSAKGVYEGGNAQARVKGNTDLMEFLAANLKK